MTHFITAASTDNYTTKKQTSFFQQCRLFSQLFLYFVNNSCGTLLICISQTELYVIFLYKSHGKENNLARDPIGLWLMSPIWLVAKDPICIGASTFFSKPILISCEATTWQSGWRFHARVQEFCEGGGGGLYQLSLNSHKSC